MFKLFVFACMLAVAVAAPGVVLNGRQFAYASPLAYGGAPLAYAGSPLTYSAPLAGSPLAYAAAPGTYSGISYNAGILKPYAYSGLPAAYL